MAGKKAFNKDFFNEWSPEMAYVLGYIFADGSVWLNKRGGSYLEFTSVDLELIVKLRKLIDSDHKIGVYKLKNKKSKTRYRLQIGSNDIVKKLNSFGIIQNKSLVIKFPKVPDKFLGHFVRGYFDGDGSVNLGNYWRKDRNKWKWEFTTRFTSGSKSSLDSLWKKLRSYVDGGYLYKKERGYELVFARRDSVALYGLMYNNVVSDVFLERKYDKFSEAFKVLTLRA